MLEYCEAVGLLVSFFVFSARKVEENEDIKN